MSERVEIRREFRTSDPEGIIEHHRRVVPDEFGLNSEFMSMIADAIAEQRRRGWPTEREGIWIVERDGVHAGSMALTDEGDTGVVRWVLLDSDLRGRGLGRQMLAELLAKARKVGYERVRLETFSELRAAAYLYREAGFEIVREETGQRWGRDSITYQHYELSLEDAPAEATPVMDRIAG